MYPDRSRRIHVRDRILTDIPRALRRGHRASNCDPGTIVSSS